MDVERLLLRLKEVVGEDGTDGRAALVVLRLSLGFASERASAVVAQTERIVGDEITAGSGLRASLSGERTSRRLGSS